MNVSITFRGACAMTMPMSDRSQPRFLLKAVMSGALVIGASGGMQAKAGEASSFCLIVSCKNELAAVEIYAPASICYAGVDEFFRGLRKDNRGYYALDLREAGKGKPLEPVHLRAMEGGRGIEIDQYTRGLPPTRVPKEGGVVSFDKRFAEDMSCSPLLETAAPGERSD